MRIVTVASQIEMVVTWWHGQGPVGWQLDGSIRGQPRRREGLDAVDGAHTQVPNLEVKHLSKGIIHFMGKKLQNYLDESR